MIRNRCKQVLQLSQDTKWENNKITINLPNKHNALVYPGDILVMLLNVPYHKVHDYIIFRRGDLNAFRDIKPFMK